MPEQAQQPSAELSVPVAAGAQELPMADAQGGALPESYADCDNCGNALIGPYCWSCGQPTRHFIRFFPALIAEALDGLFDLDSRLHRTLMPLMFRPGTLTVDYIEGRRARYVPPLRLYLFTSIVFFLVMALMADVNVIDEGLSEGERVELTEQMAEAQRELDRLDQEDLATSGTVDPEAAAARAMARAQIARIQERLAMADLEEQIREQRASAATATDPPQTPADTDTDTTATTDAATTGAAPDPQATAQQQTDETNVEIGADEIGADEIGADALTRLADETGAAEPDAAEAGQVIAARNDEDGFNISIFGDDWDPNTEPVDVGWFPDWLNQALTEEAINLEAKTERIEENPQLIVDEFFNVLPQVMFVLVPLFALILKLMYVFKRRYYMEHLILALNSHSFLFLCMLIMLFIGQIDEWVAARWPGVGEVVGVIAMGIMIALWIWIPIYLFIAQKRMYRQGWIMTIIKYLVTGTLYFALLISGTVVAAVLGVVMME